MDTPISVFGSVHLRYSFKHLTWLMNTEDLDQTPWAVWSVLKQFVNVYPINRSNHLSAHMLKNDCLPWIVWVGFKPTAGGFYWFKVSVLNHLIKTANKIFALQMPWVHRGLMPPGMAKIRLCQCFAWAQGYKTFSTLTHSLLKSPNKH